MYQYKKEKIKTDIANMKMDIQRICGIISKLKKVKL